MISQTWRMLGDASLSQKCYGGYVLKHQISREKLNGSVVGKGIANLCHDVPDITWAIWDGLAGVTAKTSMMVVIPETLARRKYTA